jgi:hypothetical protein
MDQLQMDALETLKLVNYQDNRCNWKNTTLNSGESCPKDHRPVWPVDYAEPQWNFIDWIGTIGPWEGKYNTKDI